MKSKLAEGRNVQEQLQPLLPNRPASTTASHHLSAAMISRGDKPQCCQACLSTFTRMRLLLLAGNLLRLAHPFSGEQFARSSLPEFVQLPAATSRRRQGIENTNTSAEINH